MNEIINTCGRLKEIIKSRNVQAIILGDIHGYNREYNCQKEIIENVQPSCVLVESITIIGHIIDNIDNARVLDMHNEDITCDWQDYMINESEIIIKTNNFCFRSKLCDLSEEEQDCLRRELLAEYDYIEFPNIETAFDNYDKEHPEYNLKRLFNNRREKRMGEYIRDCLEEGKIILVIIGHEHAGECSNIHNFIKDIEYVAIWRSNNYCRSCGRKIAEYSENENCNHCGNVLYSFIINKR